MEQFDAACVNYEVGWALEQGPTYGVVLTYPDLCGCVFRAHGTSAFRNIPSTQNPHNLQLIF